MLIKLFGTTAGVGIAIVLGVHSALAGPVVVDGTDANDHGDGTSTANYDGWLYMQKIVDNLSSQVGNGNKTLVDLGTTKNTQARNAIDNAFNLSTLPSSGWSINHINSSDIASYLDGATVGGSSLASTGILYVPTVGNTVGDLSDTALNQINTRGAAIANFVSGAGDPQKGGGLFSMAESPFSSGTTSYGWLKSVIPGISVTDYTSGGVQSTNLSLTSAGKQAFPSLTNSDLSAGPWHNSFTGNFGSLSVLATASDNKGVTQPLILGGGVATAISPTPPVLAPTSVPEPSPVLGMLTFGAFAAGSLFKRRQKQECGQK